MKKAILIMALLAFSFVSFAQNNTPKPDSAKTPATEQKAHTAAKQKPYAPDPARLYTVSLNAEVLRLLIGTSSTGVVPFYKSTQTPMNQMDALDEFFKGIYRDIQTQVSVQMKADRNKFIADSLKSEAINRKLNNLQGNK